MIENDKIFQNLMKIHCKNYENKHFKIYVEEQNEDGYEFIE